MNVNKLPLLSLPYLRWKALRNNELFPYLISPRYKSDSALACLFGFCSRPASFLRNRICNTSDIFNSSYRQLSRYSASTIMRPHTKSFSFKDYDVIGFDLDGTILRYNIGEMIPLEYEELCRYLVEYKGYSNQLLGSLKSSYDKDFLQKGLFLDAERGNILKFGKDGRILKANHGTKSMSDQEIVACYGKERQWSVTMQFIKDPLCAWNGPLADKMRSLLDYFDISASLVFARAVDEVDARYGYVQQSYTVWQDILEALINTYTRDNFSNGKSAYFEKLKNDPVRYLLKTSPDVINWLKDLRAVKKKLFLLTGSHIDFANFTASYAMGENWRDLFDVVICFARKPGFFHASRPFHNIDGFKETDPIALDEELQLNAVYSMGNWPQLRKLFSTIMCKNPSKMKSLYIGDNLIQDVYAPKALANIDSIAVCEEMLGEYSVNNAYNPNTFPFRDVVVSNYWNSYFFTDGQPTLWVDTIAKYSKMCVPTLDHLAAKPINYQFCMDNETGFYPSPPTDGES